MWIWIANKFAEFHTKILNQSEKIVKRFNGLLYFESPCNICLVWWSPWSCVTVTTTERSQVHGVPARCPAGKCISNWQCDKWLAKNVWTAKRHSMHRLLSTCKLHDNHATNAQEPRYSDWATEVITHERVYQTPARDVDELCVIETWSAISRASMVKWLIGGEIDLIRVSNS